MARGSDKTGNMIRCIFMDIDNTILDFDAFVEYAMREGFREFGLPAFREDMLPVFHETNTVLWNAIEQGTGTLDDVRANRWNLIFAKLGFKADGPAFEEYFRQTLHETTIPVPGAPQLIRYLSGRYVLCAASNGPYEQQVYRMRKAGLSDYFLKLFISEEIGASKPSAAFFDRCISQLNEDAQFSKQPLHPEEILMLGDSLTADIDGAVGYGLKTCYYDRSAEGTKGRHVDYYVTDLRELTQIL